MMSKAVQVVWHWQPSQGTSTDAKEQQKLPW